MDQVDSLFKPGPMNLLGLVVMFQSDDYCSFFAPFFDIAVRLGSLFQRKTFIDDRFDLPRLNKLFDKYEIIGLFGVGFSTSLS